MNLHNFAKVFSDCKSHLNYVDFILLTCQINPATYQSAQPKDIVRFFSDPTLHIPHVGRAAPLPLPATRVVVAGKKTKTTTETTKCCYEMKIFLKFLDPKTNIKSSETQSHRTSVESGRGRPKGGECLARGCVASW